MPADEKGFYESRRNFRLYRQARNKYIIRFGDNFDQVLNAIPRKLSDMRRFLDFIRPEKKPGAKPPANGFPR